MTKSGVICGRVFDLAAELAMLGFAICSGKTRTVTCVGQIHVSAWASIPTEYEDISLFQRARGRSMTLRSSHILVTPHSLAVIEIFIAFGRGEDGHDFGKASPHAYCGHPSLMTFMNKTASYHLQIWETAMQPVTKTLPMGMNSHILHEDSGHMLELR